MTTSYDRFINRHLEKESGIDPSLALIVASLLNAQQQEPDPLDYINQLPPEEQMAYTFQVLSDGQEEMPYPEGPRGSMPMSLQDLVEEGDSEDE